jgi:hypothetical protein
MRVDDRILFSLRSPSIVRCATKADQHFFAFQLQYAGRIPWVGAQSTPFVSPRKGTQQAEQRSPVRPPILYLSNQSLPIDLRNAAVAWGVASGWEWTWDQALLLE